MSMYFQGIKYAEEINISFGMRDGPDITDIQRFRQGDQVTLAFPVAHAMAEAIEQCLPKHESFNVVNDSLGLVSRAEGKSDVWLRFTVARIRHAFSLDPQTPTTMREIGHDLLLKADSGYVEDLLLLICGHASPPWYQDYIKGECHA